MCDAFLTDSRQSELAQGMIWHGRKTAADPADDIIGQTSDQTRALQMRHADS